MERRTRQGLALGGILMLGLMAFLVVRATPTDAPSAPDGESARSPRGDRRAGVRTPKDGEPETSRPQQVDRAVSSDTAEELLEPMSPGLVHLLDAYGLSELDCPEMVWAPGTDGPDMYDSVGLRVLNRYNSTRVVRSELARAGRFTHPLQAATMIAETGSGGRSVFTLDRGGCTRLSDEEAYEDIEVTVLTVDGEPTGDCRIGGCGVSTWYREGSKIRVLNLTGCEITAMCSAGFAYTENKGGPIELTLSPEGMVEYYAERQPSDLDDPTGEAQALVASLDLELEPELRAVLETIAYDNLGIAVREK